MALWSLTCIIGSFLRKSQTTQRPQGDVDARMCCTCLFHDKQLMQSGGVDFAPGVKYSLGLFMSQIKISESPAPEAKRLG